MMSEFHARILVVEDEADIRRFVRMTLESDGHEVFEADCAKRGLIEAGTRRPDLAVMDLGLPDGDGVDLIKDLRQWSMMPVIVLSARSTEAEKIAALDAGADDFLVKPFGSGELMARVRAQLRRQAQPNPSSEPLIEFGDVSIDLLKRSVKKQGQALHLTPIEYRLLTYLVSQRDCVITHTQLVKSVWGPSHVEDKHYVRVHMANLRKKLEDNPSHPKHLMTEAGVGYRFKYL
jgi:two-component system, OmpR family, KDP operon response regulator KdpE